MCFYELLPPSSLPALPLPLPPSRFFRLSLSSSPNPAPLRCCPLKKCLGPPREFSLLFLLCCVQWATRGERKGRQKAEANRTGEWQKTRQGKGCWQRGKESVCSRAKNWQHMRENGGGNPARVQSRQREFLFSKGSIYSNLSPADCLRVQEEKRRGSRVKNSHQNDDAPGFF